MSDINEMNVGPRWYIAHTYSGYENKVKANIEKTVENRHLEHLIYDVRIPMVITVENLKRKRKKRRKKWIIKKTVEKKEKVTVKKRITESKMYPAYVFVHMTMTDESWHAVRNITGVTGFVGPGSSPVPLSDAEVAAIIKTEHVAESPAFKVGDKVAITGGLFAAFNYTGVLSEISEDSEDVTVVVSTAGRDMPVKLNIKDIKRIEE